MNLSEHFTLEELTVSPTAQRLGINNDANPTIVANLMRLVDGLEKVRTLLGYPLRINSGFRCQALNAAIGGASNSQHMAGMAADFTCVEFGGPISIVRAIQASGIEFDQLIQEGTWVHISFAPVNRRQVLTAHFGAGGTTYSQGA